MLDLPKDSVLYQALVARDPSYEGVAWVGVATTGIFCRLVCPAKKPKRENCSFYGSIKDAMLAGFRPCLRCRPLATGARSPSLDALLHAIDQDPSRRFRQGDLAALGLDASTARRLFQRAFGMTFVEFSRARRLGLAFTALREGAPVIDAQLEAGFESGSGFRDAFSKILGEAPARGRARRLLRASWLESPLGAIIAIGDESHLYLLELVDRRGLEREIEGLRRRLGAAIVPGETEPLLRIRAELRSYFRGAALHFTTPLAFLGTDFQRDVWTALRAIPPGETRSYEALAKALGRPNAVRAVARANGANQLAIVVPCHRVVGKDGALTGYAGGVHRKRWLLDHEARAAENARGAAPTARA